MEDVPLVAVITGPTGTGKTELGVVLARELGGEIVSADSMQIYRGLDIGTAKPTPGEQGGIPHHMLDFVDPREQYSVARYVEDAAEAIRSILARGALPIIVGGTGLYIDSLVSGRTFSGVDGELRRRAELGAEYDAQGGDEMLRRLRLIDPERAAILSPADRRRIVRALEIFELTGKTITQHDAETRALPPRFRARTIALDFKNRADLYSRLDSRVDTMLERGLVDEVRSLMADGPGRDSTAMQAIGYKEIALSLDGEISLEEAVRRIKQGTRNYAKRQLTWLRRRSDIHWIRWDTVPDFDFARRNSTEYITLPI